MEELRLLANELVENGDNRGKLLESLLAERNRVTIDTPLGKITAEEGGEPDCPEIYVEMQLPNGEFLELACIEADPNLNDGGRVVVSYYNSTVECYNDKERLGLKDNLDLLLINALYDVAAEKISDFDMIIQKADELHAEFTKKENAYELIRTRNLTELAEELLNEK